jgi:hypothetical protein
MVDIVSTRALQPNVYNITRALRGRTIWIRERSPLCISASNSAQLWTRLKSAAIPPKSAFWDASAPLLKGNAVSSSSRQRYRRGDAVTTIASSSRDTGGLSDGEENENVNRSGFSPRDQFGLYPWDPSFQAADFDGITAVFPLHL